MKQKKRVRLSQLLGCGNEVHGRTQRLFGIEFELENVRTHETTNLLKVTHDGSLRNNGVEFITNPEPITGAVKATKELYRQADKYGYAASPRTSTHVHINAQDFDIDQVANVVCAYTLSEPFLFGFAGKNRFLNPFTVPAIIRPSPLEAVRSFNKSVTQDGRHDLTAFLRYPRYSALNLASLRKYGTIEFRQAETFSSAEKTIQWLRILGNLVWKGCMYNFSRQLEDYSLNKEKFFSKLYGRTWKSLELAGDIKTVVDPLYVADSYLSVEDGSEYSDEEWMAPVYLYNEYEDLYEVDETLERDAGEATQANVRR